MLQLSFQASMWFPYAFSLHYILFFFFFFHFFNNFSNCFNLQKKIFDVLYKVAGVPVLKSYRTKIIVRTWLMSCYFSYFLIFGFVLEFFFPVYPFKFIITYFLEFKKLNHPPNLNHFSSSHPSFFLFSLTIWSVYRKGVISFLFNDIKCFHAYNCGVSIVAIMTLHGNHFVAAQIYTFESN